MDAARLVFSPFLAAAILVLTLSAKSLAVEFDRIVIDDHFPGAYQVEVADVNGDKRPDIVAIGGGTCAWYENPSWKKRIVTAPDQTPSIISSATADFDGDGKAEIAIAYAFAMNQPTQGKLLLATQDKGIDDPWTLTHVADVGSIHRLRWGNIFFNARVLPDSVVLDTKPGLVVAPMVGPSARPPAFDQEPAHIVAFGLAPRVESKLPLSAPGGSLGGGIGGGGIGGGLGGGVVGGLGVVTGGLPRPGDPPAPRFHEKWHHPTGPMKIGDAPVVHAIDVVDLEGRGVPTVLWASNLGVTRYDLVAIAGAPIYRATTIVPGAPGDAPKKGASEVRAGRLKDGRRFLVTVEPWHGTDVAVYLSESLKPLVRFGPRTMMDGSLTEGHGLCVADVDGDGDDEVFAGDRGPATSVLMFDFDGRTWSRTVVDRSIATQDLRGGDLDADGTPDVVAVGGKTHNVLWYKCRANPRPR